MSVYENKSHKRDFEDKETRLLQRRKESRERPARVPLASSRSKDATFSVRTLFSFEFSLFQSLLVPEYAFPLEPRYADTSKELPLYECASSCVIIIRPPSDTTFESESRTLTLHSFSRSHHRLHRFCEGAASFAVAPRTPRRATPGDEKRKEERKEERKKGLFSPFSLSFSLLWRVFLFFFDTRCLWKVSRKGALPRLA